MNYSTISKIGPNISQPVNNPLSYCLNNQIEQGFLHGPSAFTLGENSKECQIFLSEYCSAGWDNYCETASQNSNRSFPNQMPASCQSSPPEVNGHRTTQGEMLIYNTASRKYLVHMYGGELVSEQFDPNVATSPMISYYSPNYTISSSMVPVYAVNPAIIDNDHVMDKLLMNPAIAPNILINIYNTMKKNNTLSQLHGTKLGTFYNIVPFFRNMGGLGV
jgi:hypothetical protein